MGVVIKHHAFSSADAPVSIPSGGAAPRRHPAEGPLGGLLVGPMPVSPWGQQDVCSGPGTVCGPSGASSLLG